MRSLGTEGRLWRVTRTRGDRDEEGSTSGRDGAGRRRRRLVLEGRVLVGDGVSAGVIGSSRKARSGSIVEEAPVGAVLLVLVLGDVG